MASKKPHTFTTTTLLYKIYGKMIAIWGAVSNFTYKDASLYIYTGSHRSHQSQEDETARSSFRSIQTGGEVERRLTRAAVFSMVVFEPLASLLACRGLLLPLATRQRQDKPRRRLLLILTRAYLQ